jgi:hypothetical protein
MAALIGAPAVIVTAIAAWSAGRASGRGAHRGPVDAVRRAAQRDAYSALLAAARRLEQAVDASNAILPDRRPVVDTQEARQAVTALPHAGDLVLLEGPDALTGPTERLLSAEEQIYAASLVWGNPLGPPTQYDAETVRQYHGAVADFVTEARRHLNGHTAPDA